VRYLETETNKEHGKCFFQNFASTVVGNVKGTGHDLLNLSLYHEKKYCDFNGF
jgi:hypothetical protein